MKMFNKGLVACAVTAALTIPMTAMATNGYFSHGYGTKNKGLAGGGVALAQDAMIAATNPAGMVTVGDRMDLGLAIFSPSSRGYTAGNPSAGPSFPLNPQTAESDNDFFVIPHIARNWMLDSKSSIGLTVYGNGGMNTEYSAAANVFGAGVAGVNLEQLFINTTYSRKINDTSSWGASVIVARQTFEAKGLQGFGGFSSDSANLTNRGVDDSIGFGFKFGWQGEVSKGLTLAASYQTEMDMDNFDKYKGLFAEQGDFDIPSTWTLGLAFDVTPKSKLTFDIQEIMYSDIAAIGNPLLPNLSPGNLGSSNGAGFGWEDMSIYKLGYQWSTSEDWTWRVGYSKTDQPIPSSEVLFNILAPAVMETHITFGFTTKTGADSEFNFAAMYAPEVSVSGSNPLGGATGQPVTLFMSQYELEASWAWKF